MTWFQRIFDFYIKASIHVALAVVALLLISGYYLNISIAKPVVLFTFLGSFSCYNFIKYGIEIDKYTETASLELKLIGVLSIISLLLSLYLLFDFQQTSWILLGILFILVLLYCFPFFYRDRNLRSLGVTKVLLVSLIWTGICVVFPVLESNEPMFWDVYVMACQQFLFVVALIIPFEIRDIQFDPVEIRTIPKRIGIRRTKLLGISLAAISYFLVFMKDSIYAYEIYTRLGITLLVILLLYRTPASASKYYASFWVEAVPIIWLGMIFISTGIN